MFNPRGFLTADLQNEAHALRPRRALRDYPIPVREEQATESNNYRPGGFSP